MEENLYYAIYSRKSKFTGIGESIENQIELCKNMLINKYGPDISSKILIYQDEGFTGYNTNRPEFQKMLEDIRAQKIKTIIVYRLDRISRNVSDFCNLKDELAKYNVDFISVTENFDTSSPMGVAMLMITSVFAQLERDTIAERIRDNMYELAKTGRWLGGTTPLGFKSKKIENIDFDGKKRSLYKLEIIPEEIQTINLIWDKMLELKSLTKLETYLLKAKIKTRNNNNFTRFSLTSILKNPVYVTADLEIKKFFEDMGAPIYADDSVFDNKHGLIAYNKRLEKKGHTNTMKDISKWIIAVGKHEGIISSSKFITTWKLLQNNQNKRMRTPPKNHSLLSGIIKCSSCGSYMRPRLRSTYYNNLQNFSYLCELKDKSRKKLCQCPNINGLKTDKLIISKIKELTIPSAYLITKLKELKNKSKEPPVNELQNLKLTYNNNLLKINNLIDCLSELDTLVINDVNIKIKDLKNKNIFLEKQIKDLENQEPVKIDTDKINTIANNIINNYMHTFDNLDIVSKKNLLKIILNSVEFDTKNLYLNFK